MMCCVAYWSHTPQYRQPIPSKHLSRYQLLYGTERLLPSDRSDCIVRGWGVCPAQLLGQWPLPGLPCQRLGRMQDTALVPRASVQLSWDCWWFWGCQSQKYLVECSREILWCFYDTFYPIQGISFEFLGSPAVKQCVYYMCVFVRAVHMCEVKPSISGLHGSPYRSADGNYSCTHQTAGCCALSGCCLFFINKCYCDSTAGGECCWLAGWLGVGVVMGVWMAARLGLYHSLTAD